MQTRIGRLQRDHVHPGDFAVDQDEHPFLARQAGELPQIVIQVFLPGGVAVLHGTRGGFHIELAQILVDVVPDSPLVGAELAGALKRGHHVLLVDMAQFTGRNVARFLEMRRGVRPAALLGAAHGDNRLGVRPQQDGGVDDPVLLGSSQLLAVQDEHGDGGAVGDLQLRHVAPFAHLGNGQIPPC